MGNIDLHFHTNNSDGAFSTAEILKMCEEKQLEIISITDHDSVQSYFDIKTQNLEFNGKIIPGVELSFCKDGTLYDVLGYGINVDVVDMWIKEKYSTKQKIANQKIILENMKTLYKKLGIKFDESVEIATGKKAEAYNLIKQSALAFEENKIVAPELFGEMFYKRHHTNPQSRFFVDETKNLPTLSECLDIIHKAGGISSLAHSGAYGFTNQEMVNHINYAINNGVKGLELKYNCHTPEQEEIIEDLAKGNNLYLTGGSDFHGGKIKPQVELGVVYANKNINAEKFENFLQNVKYF
jgi:predicted metal-dependent phosphoesterase TrpH